MALTKRDHRRAGVCRALLAESPAKVRCWWPSPNLEYIMRIVNVSLEPLALMEL